MGGLHYQVIFKESTWCKALFYFEKGYFIMNSEKLKFSVLMSIYHKEDLRYFNRAMQSIWNEQVVKPNEVVLVEDGKLTDELYEGIKFWKDELGKSLNIIPLEVNMGLGDALNIGLQKCNYELVARMDTDDISLPSRFEKQIESFKNNDIDICGTWVNEFEDKEGVTKTVRKTPELHQNIVKFSKSRSPMNHVSIMFKKTAVIRAGGYQKMMWIEDYYLFVRLIQLGAKFYNIQESLVNVRAGDDQLERRRGLKYLLSELKLQRKMIKLGFLSWFEFSRNVTIRLVVRMLPKQVSTFIYSIIRKF
jgi:glycosyltransferase involved in cell wall biosynthesis